MEELKKKKKTLIAFAMFLAFMFLCSIAAKGMYASGLAQVETVNPMKTFLTHEVRVEGVVSHSKESALNMINGLRVEEIYTRVGKIITTEDVLFQIDMEDLKEQITKQERDIQKLTLQLNDTNKNQNIENEKKEMTEERAKEDYNKTAQKADRQIIDADIAVHNAQVAMDEHNAKKPSVNESDRKAAESAYEDWVRMQNDLTAQCKSAEAENKNADVVKEEAKKALKEAEERGDAEDILIPLREAVALAESNAAEKANQYHTVKEALDKHLQNPIAKPDNSAFESQLSAWESTKKQLEQSLALAQRAKNNLNADKKESLENAERVIEDSKQDMGSDSADERLKIELAEKAELLEKYKKVYEQDGKIRSAVPGMVIACNVQTGDRTADGPAVKIADTSENQTFEFQATITKEEKKYINRKDEGELLLAGEGGKIPVVLDYVTENAYVPDSFDIAAILPEKTGYIGESGTLLMTSQSESYSLCIPVNALHSDGNGGYIVYVMSKKETILGTEMAVTRVSVGVADKNEKYAALTEGGLIDNQTEIVTTFTKELKEGMSVRYKEW